MIISLPREANWLPGRTILEYLGRIDVITNTKATTGPLSNGKPITQASDHLNLDTKGNFDCLLGVFVLRS